MDACAQPYICIYLISLHTDKFYFLYTHTHSHSQVQTRIHILCACVYGISILAIVAMPSKVSKTLISFLSTVSNGNVPDVYDCRFSLSFLVFPLSLSLFLSCTLTHTFFPCYADTSCSGPDDGPSESNYTY